jgi:AcrR family transcriptional regulator
VSRRERTTARNRASIAAAARELFDAQGFEATTIEQIAEAADLAPRTVYRYFPTKELLLFADLDDIRRELLDRYRQAPTDAEPLPALLDVMEGLAPVVQARRATLARAFSLARDHAPTKAQGLAEVRDETIAPLAELVGERLGVDPESDPRPGAWATIAVVLFIAAIRTAATNPRRRVDRILSELIADTRAALATPDRESVGPRSR